MQNHYYHTNRRKYNLKTHIILVTKYRKTLLQNGMDEFVKIGRNTHSGLTDTLLAALAKYHQ